MADDKQIDYAALIRAGRTEVPQPPDWLAVGKQIYSGEHGIGEVMALLGQRLIVRFLEDINPTQFPDWVSQVESNLLLPSQGTIASTSVSAEVTGDTQRVSQSQIQTIPHLAMRAIAFELAPSLVAIDVTEGNPGDLYPLPKDLPPSLHEALNRSGITNFLVRDKTLKNRKGKGFMEIANSPMKPYELGYSTTANFAASFSMAWSALKLSSNVPDCPVSRQNHQFDRASEWIYGTGANRLSL